MGAAPTFQRRNNPEQIDCDELNTLTESYQCEVKDAPGREGEGKLPKSIWESYSSFSNTQGGKIVLGAKELDDGTLQPVGLQSVTNLEKDFWNTVNNKSKVNKNILTNQHVQHLVCEDAHLLILHVPPATRKDRPVYINDNPMRGVVLTSASTTATTFAVRRQYAGCLPRRVTIPKTTTSSSTTR